MSENEIVLLKGKFSIEGEKPFNGYHDPTRLWNGWHCPYFEWDEAVEIVRWINKWREEFQLSIEHDQRTITCMEQPGEPFEIEPIEMETEEGKKLLYPIGTGWWVWVAQEK
jgi:hypothetical protein